MKSKVLSFNAGKDSLRFKLFEAGTERELVSGEMVGIGLGVHPVKLTVRGVPLVKKASFQDHVEAALYAIRSLKEYGAVLDLSEIEVVGHKVAHGGEKYKSSCPVDAQVIKDIRSFSGYAPEHNPASLATILACGKALSDASQVAVFDTAFHHTLPREAYLFTLPYYFYEKGKIRKYGSHGQAHQHLSTQARLLLGKPGSRIVTCHIGEDISLSAIQDGKVIDTHSCFSEIDADVLLHLAQRLELSPAQAADVVRASKGWKAVAGLPGKKSAGLKEAWHARLEGSEDAKRAFAMLARKAAFIIGGYNTLLGGMDALVFSTEPDENLWPVRRDICRYLEPSGVRIDATSNRKNHLLISEDASKAKVYVVPLDEELQIAREAVKALE